jgi:hypothetical protein
LILPALGAGRAGAQSRTDHSEVLLKRALAGLSAAGRRLVLLLDQFESLDRVPPFQASLGAHLRSLTHDFRLCWVSSTSQGSPAPPPAGNFAVDRDTLWLEPFTEEEARELITVPSGRAGKPLAGFAGRIIEMAGLSPFFLQIACSALFDRLEPAEPRLPDICEVFQEEAAPHFELLVEGLGSGSLHLLEELAASGRARSDLLAESCSLLFWAGLTLREDEDWVTAPTMFLDYLRGFLGTRSSLAETGEQDPRQAQPLNAGAVVHQYRVLAPVGGQVYRAKSSSGRRLVALKIIKPDRFQAAALLKSSKEEIRRAAAISHDAIASVFEVLEYQGTLVVISEWLEGETLREKMNREGRLLQPRLLRWMAEACGGLRAASRQGLTHRHIKPSNLMVTSRGHLKILDFGFFDHPLQAPQSGSPRSIHPEAVCYLAPEQASGQQADTRSDLFSLGVVFFEGLTGRVPFRRSTASSTLQSILNDPLPELAAYGVESAESLQPVLSRLLQKHPSRRYQTAAEVERDLRKLLRQSRGRLFGRWSPRG